MTNDYFKLCQLTLTAHTHEAGEALDAKIYNDGIRSAIERDHLVEYRHQNEVQGFVTLKDNGSGSWFVLLIVIHPDHRNRRVFMELFIQAYKKMMTSGLDNIKSNVFKTNQLSVEFHKKLGFLITRENEKGYEFTLDVAEHSNNLWLQRIQKAMA